MSFNIYFKKTIAKTQNLLILFQNIYVNDILLSYRKIRTVIKVHLGDFFINFRFIH